MNIPNEKRKEYPVFEGFIKYFPDAIMAVAHHSWLANEKHNKGKHLHWDRSKSTDEKDSEMRHMIDIAKGHIVDEDGLDTYVAKAWRAMADLQKHLEGQYADKHATVQYVDNVTYKKNGLIPWDKKVSILKRTKDIIEDSRPHPTGYVVNASNVDNFIKRIKDGVEDSMKNENDIDTFINKMEKTAEKLRAVKEILLNQKIEDLKLNKYNL